MKQVGARRCLGGTCSKWGVGISLLVAFTWLLVHQTRNMRPSLPREPQPSLSPAPARETPTVQEKEAAPGRLPDENVLEDRQLEKTDFDALLAYSEKRQSLAFLDRIENELSERLKQGRFVSSLKEAIAKDMNAPFLPDTERRHISMLNYLEDASLGRFENENRDEALDAVVSLLTTVPIDKNTPKRHLQFQVGDKVDLMMIWTQSNRDEAFQYLSSQKDSDLFPDLEEGYLNGLFFLGLTQ